MMFFSYTKIQWILDVLLLGFVTSSCVTPYQPENFNGGYSEMQLDTDLYKVSFKGNSNTSSDIVTKNWMRRCAELTQEKGYSYFEIVSDDAHTDVSENTNPTYCSGMTFGNTTHITCSGGGVTRINRHEVNGRIRMLKEKPSVRDPNVFDAKIVLGNFSGH